MQERLAFLFRSDSMQAVECLTMPPRPAVTYSVILEMLSSPSNVSIKKPLIVVGKDIRPLPRRFDALKAVQFDKSWGDVELARLIAHTLTPSN